MVGVKLERDAFIAAVKKEKEKKKPRRVYVVGCLGLSGCHTLPVMTELIMARKKKQ